MYPAKCAACGGRVEVSRAPIQMEVRGETASVEGVEHGRCTTCGESYLSLDAAEHLQAEAVRQARAAKGLLGPQEIRDIRHSLGLSQAAFERLLGVGAKTVVRWEKGTVFQGATADRLMRLIRYSPELADVLAGGSLYGSTSEGNTTRPAPSRSAIL